MKEKLLLAVSCSVGTVFGSSTTILSGTTLSSFQLFNLRTCIIISILIFAFAILIYFTKTYLIRQKIKFIAQLDELVEKKLSAISKHDTSDIVDTESKSTITFSPLIGCPVNNDKQIVIEKNCGISDQKCDEITDKLTTYMKEQKPYLNADLRQVDVVAAVGYSMREVSIVLNTKLNQNFSDFVNSYRVDEIKSRIVNKQLEKYTLTAIALECGFNAKTSFHRAFKKATNMTPTDYFKEINIESSKTICFDSKVEIPVYALNHKIRIPNKNIALL